MSQLVKTKRQANFKGFKPLRDSSNKKTLYSTRSFVNWAFFGTRAKKGPIYTQTRQINDYICKQEVKSTIKAEETTCFFILLDFFFVAKLFFMNFYVSTSKLLWTQLCCTCSFTNSESLNFKAHFFSDKTF
jgi:hypothetical protein